jgi:hypothetical protein
MKLPLLEHPGLYLTAEFLSRNPPAPARPERVEYSGAGEEPDLERLAAELGDVMSESAEPAATDGIVACALHATLRLTRREAADMRFWHYLCAVRFPHYVSWRYFDARSAKTAKNRYAGVLDDNALARLWWFAEMMLDPAAGDPYWRVRTTAGSLEFVKGIVENLFGGNRSLVNGLADALFNGRGKPPDSLVQRAFTTANVLLAGIAVDALSDEEISQFARRICSSASAAQE